MFYDMMAVYYDGVTSMNVVVQNIGAAYGALLDEETMVDETIKVLPDQLAAASMDVQSANTSRLSLPAQITTEYSRTAP